MRNLQMLLGTTLFVGLLPLHAALAADKWFLWSRHGECFPIRSLERKFPDMSAITEPESFIKFVQAKGFKVTTKAMPVQAGAAVEVLVPEQELALVFVTAELCSRTGPR